MSKSVVYRGNQKSHNITIDSSGDLKGGENQALQTFPERTNPEPKNPESQKW